MVENGSVVESYDYDPWGVLMDGRTLDGATRERFTGKERDPSGLDYFGLRYYMSAVGRWSTVDPPADSFPNWSPYNYVYNNPVSYSDPLGLCPERMGGDGRTSSRLDCPEGSAGYQRVSGGVREAIGPVDALALAGSLGAAAFRGAAGLSSRVLLRETRSLQKFFSKHGDAFGLAGNWNRQGAADASRVIHQHVNSAGVRTIQGTYRGNPATHFLDPSSGLNVVADPNGRFVTGFRLSANQLESVLQSGRLW